MDLETFPQVTWRMINRVIVDAGDGQHWISE